MSNKFEIKPITKEDMQKLSGGASNGGGIPVMQGLYDSYKLNQFKSNLGGANNK